MDYGAFQYPPTLESGDVLLVLGGANDFIGEGTVAQVMASYESLKVYAKKPAHAV